MKMNKLDTQVSIQMSLTKTMFKEKASFKSVPIVHLKYSISMRLNNDVKNNGKYCKYIHTHIYCLYTSCSLPTCTLAGH